MKIPRGKNKRKCENKRKGGVMKYSVLMSVYKKDNPEWLLTALQSIYERQTKKPDEIVIVFDGPLTDELYEVLDRFRKDKEGIVKYYPQNDNQGLGVALRIGSAYCTGDYIFRMDSDDISVEQRFERQVEYLESHPNIDVLGTDIAEFKNSPAEKKKIRRCPATHEEIVSMGKSRTPMNHMSVCIKRSALDKSGGYESCLFMEDYYLWLKMIVAGCRLENLHESLVYVRTDDNFIGRRSAKQQISSRKFLQKYMLEHKMINRVQACINMIKIRIFVYAPPKVKKIVYEKILRK